ncbi:MAG: hypothetical protein P4L50_04085 [Anaerolineaceae bacterium]|nr:hypothetical protein [Anaerolineaceae bacterium]
MNFTSFPTQTCNENGLLAGLSQDRNPWRISSGRPYPQPPCGRRKMRGVHLSAAFVPQDGLVSNGWKNLAKARHLFDAKPDQALRLICQK